MPTWMEKSVAFYASYHDEPRNKIIHFLFVWPIFFTAQVFLTYAPELPAGLASALPFQANWCLLLSICYATYYALIEQPGIAGPFSAALVMGGYYATQAIREAFPECWKLALFIHIFAWAAQIFGHQVFEKRAPAFLDNIVQALVMAPLFVVLEVFFIFGYKPSLQAVVHDIARKDIAEFRSKQQRKSL